MGLSVVFGFTTTYAISASWSLTLWVQIQFRRGGLDTTLCDKVCQWLSTGLLFSPGTPVSSTNKTDRHDTTEKLLKLTWNTKNHKHKTLASWSGKQCIWLDASP